MKRNLQSGSCLLMNCCNFSRCWVKYCPSMQLDRFVCTVQVIGKDVDRGRFSEGGQTVIYVSEEEPGSVKLLGDFKGFINDVVHNDARY